MSLVFSWFQHRHSANPLEIFLVCRFWRLYNFKSKPAAAPTRLGIRCHSSPALLSLFLLATLLTFFAAIAHNLPFSSVQKDKFVGFAMQFVH
jgi:hypothetical protein